MKRETFITICILIIFSISLNAGVKPVCKIIPQTDGPVEINKYNAKYVEGSIRHEIYYTSLSERKIVALEFGFISYDIWDEYIGHLNGLTISDLKPMHKLMWKSWTHNCYYDFAFHTGFAYINKIRYENGEIWVSDKDVVLEEIRKFDENFDMTKLERKEDE